MPQMSHMPFFIRYILDKTYPVVGDSHGKTIIKSDAAGRKRNGQTGHSADILGNGNGIGSNIMDEFIGKGKIREGILVHTVVKIVIVRSECFRQSVMQVEHAGYTVKTETVKAVFIQPETAVGKQKVEYLVLIIVEASGIPGFMNAPRPLVKILISCAVEPAQSLHLV